MMASTSTPLRSLAGRGLRVVGVGASAGGIDALFALLESLPATLPVAIVVVLHLPDGHQSQLPDIFGARLKLKVHEADPGQQLAPGHVYFAPPSYHLLVEPDGSFSLSCEPPVHFSRPSIDVMFESAAEAFGPHFLGMVLTGANEDGARGLAKVRELGGLSVVQDPREARYPTMPQAALELAGADAVLPLAGLHALLLTLGQT